MDYQIRQYKKPDLNDVLSVWENASKLAHPFLSKEFMEQERYNLPNVYLPSTDTWVAELDSKVVGFIALLGNEIGGLFVDPDYHGRGIGRALTDKAQKLLGDLEVEVFQDNQIGCRFYSLYGFKLLAQKKHEETGKNLLRLKLIANET